MFNKNLIFPCNITVKIKRKTVINIEYCKMKRKMNRNSQYFRQENLEFSGIPERIDDDCLESTVISLLQKTGVEVSPNDIVDVHRLKNKKSVIIRFVNRKHAKKALANSRLLKGNTEDIIKNSVIYCNRNLTPEYKSLRWMAKKMCSASHIKAFGTNSKGVWVKGELYGAKKQVDVEEDLMEFLPEGISLSGVCKT